QYPDLPEPPSVTARRFYYDTVGHGSQAALLCAWKAFGPDHLVAGSDYPVLLAFETYRQTFHYIHGCGLPREGGAKNLNPNSSTTTPRSSWACRTETLLPHHREVGPWTWGFEASMRS